MGDSPLENGGDVVLNVSPSFRSPRVRADPTVPEIGPTAGPQPAEILI